MRIIVHDFSGHPFQIELSRALAARHDVLHVHCPSYSTGKGRLDRQESDVRSLTIQPIEVGPTWDRYAYTKRVWQEVQYGRAFARAAQDFRPDVVVSSNDPLFAKAISARWCQANSVPWVFWLQDVYSAAMGFHARRSLGTLGVPIASSFEALERRLLHMASGVVAITEDFLPLLRSWGVPDERTTVIENWAPVDEIEPGPRSNPWSTRHGIEDKKVILYAGTIGLKHNPSLLTRTAERFRHDSSVVVVVASEGLGADWLRERVRTQGLTNVVLLPFQPWEQMSDVLASADILTALLEPEAGVYSVPSKVLTYFCAGRAMVGSIPEENLAARLIDSVGAGWVTSPDDDQAFVDVVAHALESPEALTAAGNAARNYAVEAFDIGTICDRFESVLAAATDARAVRSS